MKHIELFKDGFDSTINEKIQPENWPYVAYSKTEGIIYTLVHEEDGTMYTIYKIVNKDISNCTYNTVDLGLKKQARDENGVPLYELTDTGRIDYNKPIFTDEPLLFADRNVGATSTEDSGSYFQWGDTNPYTFDGVCKITAAELAEMLNPWLSPELGMEITADNVGIIFEQIGITGTDFTNNSMFTLSISLDKSFNWESYNEVDEITSWEEDNGYMVPSSFKKYNNSESGLKVLESVDDAATVNMGDEWRTPTYGEIIQLSPYKGKKVKADYIYDETDKPIGIMFTSLINENTMFIPCDSHPIVETLYCGIGDPYTICLLSSELNLEDIKDCRDISSDDLVAIGADFSGERCYGRCVRGVLK